MPESIVVNDLSAAMREAARLGLGVSLIALPDGLAELETDEFVRLLPDWYADGGAVHLHTRAPTCIGQESSSISPSSLSGAST